MRGLAAFAPVGLLATASALPSKRDYNTNGTASVDDFANIPVSKELTWVKCWETFTCANLEVPLDYEDEAAGTTNIAFIKLEGGNGTGPDIIFNPGGPGGSGIQTIIAGGQAMLANFGDNYNMISFDPRGVNNSGPPLTCFPDDVKSRTQYESLCAANLHAPPGDRYQLFRAGGERCTNANAETKAKYVGTSAVVQDINYFNQLNAVAKGQKAEEAKIYYYGVSYGTVIGQTLAAMYPDKIERMVLDGNVWGEGHYTGSVQDSIRDTDATVRSFFTYCALAGPEKCPFATAGATADELELRYKNILQKLEDEPLVISGLDQAVPGMVTRANLAALTFQNSYQPLQQFPLLAKVLSEIDVGDSTTYLLLQGAASGAVMELDGQKVPNPDYLMKEATQLVTCVDMADRNTLTREQYIKLARQLRESSYYGGGPMALLNAVGCAGISIQPPKSQYFAGFKETQTKNPILFINTLRDPVTPYSSAIKASKNFPGSVVLAQDTSGHGFTTVPSNCTVGYLKAYMETTELPKEGTICAGDVTPLVDTPAE